MRTTSPGSSGGKPIRSNCPRSDLEWALQDPVYDTSPWDSTSTKGFRNKLEGWGEDRARPPGATTTGCTAGSAG